MRYEIFVILNLFQDLRILPDSEWKMLNWIQHDETFPCHLASCSECISCIVSGFSASTRWEDWGHLRFFYQYSRVLWLLVPWRERRCYRPFGMLLVSFAFVLLWEASLCLHQMEYSLSITYLERITGLQISILSRSLHPVSQSFRWYSHSLVRYIRHSWSVSHRVRSWKQGSSLLRLWDPNLRP